MLKRQVLLSARSKNKKTPLSFGLYFLASSLPPVILVFLVFCHFPCVSCAPLFVSFAMRGCVTVWCWRGPSIQSPDRWSSRSPSKSVLSSTLQYFYPPGSSLTSSTDRRFDPSGKPTSHTPWIVYSSFIPYVFYLFGFSLTLSLCDPGSIKAHLPARLFISLPAIQQSHLPISGFQARF